MLTLVKNNKTIISKNTYKDCSTGTTLINQNQTKSKYNLFNLACNIIAVTITNFEVSTVILNHVDIFPGGGTS